MSQLGGLADIFGGAAVDGAQSQLEEENSGGFWKWWGRNGDEATGVARTVMCIIKPELCSSPVQVTPEASATDSPNLTPLYVLLGAMVVLVLIVLLVKSK